jgi:hypothetical protein
VYNDKYIDKQISGHMAQMGYDTKTDRLTDCQSQCDFDFDFDYIRLEIELEN